jgi:hypothetical protein
MMATPVSVIADTWAFAIDVLAIQISFAMPRYG